MTAKSQLTHLDWHSLCAILEIRSHGQAWDQLDTLTLVGELWDRWCRGCDHATIGRRVSAWVERRSLDMRALRWEEESV